MKPLSQAVFFILQLFVSCVVSAPAQEVNKVIIRDFDWQVYSTEHFDIHYYVDSKPWIDYAAITLEAAYKRESADLNPLLSKRLPFFLYSSINDMEQTGIADVSDGVGGLTEPFKDRFMTWSDGSKGWLKNVMEHELAHEMQFSVLIDGFWKSARILKTYVYPLWMMEGMAEYETGDLDIAVEEMYVGDAALSGKLIPLWRLSQFGHLKPHQVTLAYKTGAQAVRFLAAQYGAEKPRKMLALFKNRYEESSVLQPLIGADIFRFDKKFREYTELKYLSQAKKEKLQEPSRYGERITGPASEIPEFNLSPAPSPDGGKIAYISTRYGQPSSVIVKDLVSGKEKRYSPYRAGAENIPYGRFTKPLRNLAWSPDGKWLAFSGQKNHREYIYFYRPETGESKRFGVNGLSEIRQPSFSSDGLKIIFVGMRGGFNDLYRISTEQALKAGMAEYEDLERLTDSQQDEASPVSAPDGSGVVYSCEVDAVDGFRRDLCFIPASGGKPQDILSMDGDVYDPVFSADGAEIYFVSDADRRFELYSYERATGRVFRLTRSMGGSFTPVPGPAFFSKVPKCGAGPGLCTPAAGATLYFSAFRNGNMNIYAADTRNFLYEQTAGRGQGIGTAGIDRGIDKATTTPYSTFPTSLPLPVVESALMTEVYGSSGTFRPYKLSASTDLFFPAFLFSSPGGLFWMNYWQASDMLGRHNLGLYANYNSGEEYLSYEASYSYSRWRMPLTLQSSGLTSKSNLNADGLKYNRSSSVQALGTAWPFDRYNRLELSVINKNEIRDYTEINYRDSQYTRAVQSSYVRDTVNGLYLTAVSGSRFEASYLKAIQNFGGNLKYDAYTLQYLKYFPLSKRSAFVNRTIAAVSYGRDRRTFDFGGLGGVRGIGRFSPENEKSGVFINNAELRVPLAGNMDYYMWYMFPDFYFKAIYAKVFMDSAFGWDNSSQFHRLNTGKTRNSVGIGVDIHTFILQAFQLVISFDCAIRTTDGGKIFYLYLGPLF